MNNPNDNFELAQPIYLYKTPMFLVTVSTVLIFENGVILVKTGEQYAFPNIVIKAGQETASFAAIRSVKEQTGIVLKRNSLLPVDVRSEPERTPSKNIIDLGMVSILEEEPENKKAQWFEIDFENKCMRDHKLQLWGDYNVLLSRAIDIVWIMKDS